MHQIVGILSVTVDKYSGSRMMKQMINLRKKRGIIEVID